MLFYAVLVVHVVVCIFLVLVVLLQSGKGADLAGAFGGGATQTAFGSRGPASFLTRITTVVAIVFMVTSISLSMMGERRSTDDKSVLDDFMKTSAPAQEPKSDTGGAPISIPTLEQIEAERRQIEERQQQANPEAAPQEAPVE